MISITYRYTENGEIVVEDNRVFSEVVKVQIESFKNSAQQEILTLCPEFKQRNAAMGLLSEEETNYIKTKIQNIRNKCHNLEQIVLAITWDGTEETRSAACDAVQKTYWC